MAESSKKEHRHRDHHHHSDKESSHKHAQEEEKHGDTKRSKAETGYDDDLQALLEKTMLHDVLPSKPRVIFSLYHSRPIVDALEDLATEKVLSAPVVLASSAEDGDSETYMGIVDVNAILKSLLDSVSQKSTKKSVKEIWAEVGKLSADAEARSVITVIDHDVHLIYKGEREHTLGQLIREGFLGLGPDHKNQIRHRLAIFDARGRITNIISQSDIVAFLAKHSDSLGGVGTKTVKDLGFVTNDVVSINYHQTAIEALHLMHEKKVSGVAVVDLAGVLAGNFSASDLRNMRRGQFSSLLLPVLEFLESEHAHPASKHDDGSLVYCRPTDTLASVIGRLARHRVHRLYILDDHNKPVGTVTLTDVLRKIAA